jgi:hypothetical protein
MYFQAVLMEFATILVTTPEGCVLLKGPFAFTHNGALHKILRTCGSCLTWTSQREHANQLVRGMQKLYDSNTFEMLWGGGVQDVACG